MRGVNVPDPVLLALVQTSESEGGVATLDDHALAEFFRAVEASGYRQPTLSVFSDGTIECDGVPVEASGKPAAVIRAIHQHGTITRSELSKAVWGDGCVSPDTIRPGLTRARSVLSTYGLTIINLPGDRVAIDKQEP